MRVGVIGLGLMGQPIAGRILDAGHGLIVTSRRRTSAADLEDRGARWADSPFDCANNCDAVLLALPTVAAVEAVALGTDGVIAARPGMVIDVSTCPPELSRSIARACYEVGVRAVDAPVSGGPAGARSGTLSIMVGAEPADFAAAVPLLRCLGTPRHLGPAGSGQSAKLVNQVLVGATTSGIAESWALAANLGLDPNLLFEVLSGGIGAGRLLDFAWPRLEKGDLAPGFKVDQLVKDMQLSVRQGELVGLDLSVSRAALARYEELSEIGLGQLGTQALIEHPSLRSSNDNSTDQKFATQLAPDE